MKIVSYNINGIRAAIRKDFLSWLVAANPDVLCLQEIKAQHDQVDRHVFGDLGYHVAWHAAEKKGYSGVAVLSRQRPLHVEQGCGMTRYDTEGRMLRLDFETLSVLTTYMPSGSSAERQVFKMEWLEFFGHYMETLKARIPNLIVNGDFNICREPIDIHNPTANLRSPGFTPEERAWFQSFLSTGFIDCFRLFNSNPHHYSWWSYRAGARKRNLGWRIDYQLATLPMKNRLVRCVHLSEAMHSDHCPVLVEIAN